MELSFSTTFWKYTLLTFIVLISVIDVVLISCGVVALGAAASVSGAYTVTSIGSLVFLVCFVGCFASLNESYVLSITFSALSIITIIVEIVFMIAFAVIKDSLIALTADRVNYLWENELIKPGAMDNIQYQYNCCGKDSPQDYLKKDDDELPKTCCLYNDCSLDSNIYSKGCASTALNFFDSQSDNLILTTVGLILIQIGSIFSAYYLAKVVKQTGKQKAEPIIINE